MKLCRNSVKMIRKEALVTKSSRDPHKLLQESPKRTETHLLDAQIIHEKAVGVGVVPAELRAREEVVRAVGGGQHEAHVVVVQRVHERDEAARFGALVQPEDGHVAHQDGVESAAHLQVVRRSCWLKGRGFWTRYRNSPLGK